MNNGIQRAKLIAAAFLQYLKRSGSSTLLPLIISELAKKTATGQGVRVSAPVELNAKQKEKAKVLSERFFPKKDISQYTFTVDPSLIDGLKFALGDEIIDLSLQGRLKQLEK